MDELTHLNQEGTLRKLYFFSSTSPEGGLELNRRLSERRLQRLYEYIGSRVAIPDSICEFSSIGIDWKALSASVSQSDAGYREEVVHELTAGDADYGERCTKMMDLSHGDAWKDMYRRFFPSLRMGRLILYYDGLYATAPPSVPAGGYKPEIPLPDLSPATVSLPDVSPASPQKKHRFVMAVKSNLLYDVALVPNVGVEFYLKITGPWEVTGCMRGGRTTIGTATGGSMAESSMPENIWARLLRRSRFRVITWGYMPRC